MPLALRCNWVTTLLLVRSLECANIVDNGSLVFARSDSSILNNPISNSITGAGKLIQNGTGTLTLTTTNSYAAGTVINAGTLAISSNLQINNGTGGITFGGGVLQFNSYDALATLPAAAFNNVANLKLGATGTSNLTTVIGGSSILSYVGPGQLSLKGTNTYTGNTSITGGILQVTSNASLGSLTSGVVNINGGTLDLGGNTGSNNANFGAKQFNIAGTGSGGLGAIYNSGITQQNSFGKITLTADASIGGIGPMGSSNGRIDLRNNTPVLEMSGHKLTKTGDSQFTLVATTVNSTTGGAGTIEVAAGELGLETTTAIGPSAVSLITMDAGTRLEFFSTTSAVSSPVIVAGTGVIIGSGPPSGNGPSTVASPITLQNDVTFEPINTNAVNPGGTAPVTLTGNIDESGGSHGIIKLGSFPLTLSGTGTYTGTTQINAGTLAITSDAAINSGVGGITFGGGTLQFNNYASSNLPAASFNNVANLRLGAATGTASSLSTVIGGSSALNYLGPGTLTLTAVNNFIGTTSVTAGTLALGMPNGIATTSQVILQGGTLATGGVGQDFSPTGGTLAVTASSTLDLGSAVSPTSVKFADSSGNFWTGTLTINNWNYGIDHLNLSVAGGLTAQQLSQIKFADFHQGASIADGSTSLALGEVTPLVGDINQDGTLSTADIATLMSALANRDNYRTTFFNGANDPTGDVSFILDANRDGLVNNLDIQAEIGLVANFISTGSLPGALPVVGGSVSGDNSVTAVPEPASFVLLGFGETILLIQRARRKFAV